MKNKKEKKQVKKQMNVWLVSAVILILGIILGASVLLYTKTHILSGKEMSTETTGLTRELYSDENNTNPDSVSVSFYDREDKLIETKSVKFGQAVFPPAIENSTPGLVFLGWSHNLSCMTKDTQISPVFNDYRDRSNVLSFDTVYVDSSDDFSVDLKLGGVVQLASFDMVVNYDPKTVHLERIDNAADGITYDDNKNGQIVIKLRSNKNLTEAVNLLRLSFDVENVDFLKTELTVDVKNSNAFSGGESKYIDCTLVKGIVYIY